MEVITNPSHEIFAQNLATGMSIGKSYTAAEYKATGNAAETNRSQLLRNDKVQNRVAELQGSTAELITDLRDYARSYTKAAIELYVTAMNDETLGTRVRLVAAKELLDRGHGKAPQTITVEPSAYDSLELDDQQSLLAAIRHIKAYPPALYPGGIGTDFRVRLGPPETYEKGLEYAQPPFNSKFNISVISFSF